MDGDFLNYTHHEPVGVAGLISPWNWPLHLLTWKIAPCIAFGNTCVVKPSEMTSVTAWMLTECFKEAMLPPGVVNMVFGTGHRCGQPLVAHPHVELVSFTGSTLTGKHVAMTAAPLFKKTSLEMGGKNAGIIFSDVNLREVVPKVTPYHRHCSQVKAD
jgi:acyl-CoA reductase-like NAD-dependent aldehyde dehydrogenase